jgi:hypothetical protein
MAPDDLHYAYPESAAPNYARPRFANVNLHVVDIPTTTDRVIATGPGWWVLAFIADGIYVTHSGPSGESLTGLWKIDPTTGSSRQVLPESVRQLRVGGGAAWGSEVGMMSKILYRYDLGSGTSEMWYSRTDRYVTYLMSDGSGRPLVSVTPEQGPGGEIWLLTGPNKATLVRSGSDAFFAVGGFSDPLGTWMYGSSGLWLLQPAGQLIHVTTAQVQPLAACQ